MIKLKTIYNEIKLVNPNDITPEKILKIIRNNDTLKNRRILKDVAELSVLPIFDRIYDILKSLSKNKLVELYKLLDKKNV